MCSWKCFYWYLRNEVNFIIKKKLKNRSVWEEKKGQEHFRKAGNLWKVWNTLVKYQGMIRDEVAHVKDSYKLNNLNCTLKRKNQFSFKYPCSLVNISEIKAKSCSNWCFWCFIKNVNKMVQENALHQMKLKYLQLSLGQPPVLKSDFLFHGQGFHRQLWM